MPELGLDRHLVVWQGCTYQDELRMSPSSTVSLLRLSKRRVIWTLFLKAIPGTVPGEVAVLREGAVAGRKRCCA